MNVPTIKWPVGYTPSEEDVRFAHRLIEGVTEWRKRRHRRPQAQAQQAPARRNPYYRSNRYVR